MPFLMPPLLVIIAFGVVYFARHRDPASRSRFLRRAGFGLMAFVTVFFLLFVIGETLADPGGWRAVGLIALWLVPLGALAALSWYRPDRASRILVALTVAAVGVSLWAAVDSDSWRHYEDHHGPVRTIAIFVVSAAVALLGVKRTRLAGALLVVLGVVPLVVSDFGHLRGGSLMAVASPGLVTGVLYLISAALDQHPAAGPASVPIDGHKVR